MVSLSVKSCSIGYVRLFFYRMEVSYACRPEWRTDDGGYSMTFEAEYEDVLQNLEFAIIQVYRERPI